jgi:hypothetical protein
MNPDDLETIIKNFLNDNDTEAAEDLKIKEDKYKIKYNTIQDVNQGPIDVTIQVFSNPEQESADNFPYVVEFKKGARGSKQEFIKYYEEMKEKCFEETTAKEDDNQEEEEKEDDDE